MLREWALRHLGKARFVSRCFTYMEKNARLADRPILCGVMKEWRNDLDVHHDLTLSVLALTCRPSNEMLQEVFEWTACEYCRLSAAHILAKRGLLTESQRYELEFDAYHFARRYARKRKSGLDARSRLLESRA